jgi:hypothetical protein
MWDTTTGKEIVCLFMPNTAVSISRDGKCVLMAGRAGNLSYFDVIGR